MRRLLFATSLIIAFLQSGATVYAQDPFTRKNINAERFTAVRSYSIMVSTDSVPPPAGTWKLWAPDTNRLFLITPLGTRFNLKAISAGIGTVTNVTGTSPDVTVTNGTTIPNISINSGTAASRLLRLDNSARIPPVDGSLVTNINSGNVVEGTNQFFTVARARSAISGTGMIQYDPVTGVIYVNGQSITGSYILDATITDGKIASGNVVKSINGLHDFVKVVGAGGATVSTSATGDTLIITAAGGGGGGSDTLVAIQSTGTITVMNPFGPTVTIDVATNGIDSNKIMTGHVTNSDIKDGTIITADFHPNAKAPLATLADSARPYGSAAGADMIGNYPDNITVGPQRITASKILNNTITRTQVTTTFKAPYADTADFATFTSLRTDTVTLPAGQDSINVTITGLGHVSWASADYADLSDYVVPAASPTVRARSNTLTIKTWQIYPVAARLNYSYKITTK